MKHKYTTKYFIEKSKSIYGDSYLYEKTKYISARDNLTITCKIHGDFTQSPDNHFKHIGCRECRKHKYHDSKIKYNLETFISMCEKVHKKRYIYKNINYDGLLSKISILCPIHGIFIQQARFHLRGVGCKKCADNKLSLLKRMSFDTFVSRAKQVHNNNYFYNDFIYIGWNQKITITCVKHGDFIQSIGKHLLGRGCKKCAIEKIKISRQNNPNGWNDSFWMNASKKSRNYENFKVYVIFCFSKDEMFFKVGKTFNNINYRFRNKNLMPYNWVTVHYCVGDYKYISLTERLIKRQNKDKKYTPSLEFGGRFECFSSLVMPSGDVFKKEDVVDYIRRYHMEKNIIIVNE